jgi:hypothetical protein
VGGAETHCACAIDERVVDNVCSACPAGTTRAPGENPLLLNDTICSPIAYVEILVVNDKARCDAFDVFRDSDNSGEYNLAALAAMHAHSASVVAAVNQIFKQALNFETAIRVVLVDQQDWCYGDQFDVTYFDPSNPMHDGITRAGYPTGETDTATLLSAFGAWREYNLSSIPTNDVAHLFTGRDLRGNSKGDAYPYSACADDSKWCGAVNPEDSTTTLREGDCGYDSDIEATVCCYARSGGAVSAVADPLNAHTLQTTYDESHLIFESALIVAHHLGKQLGMSIDGVDNNCATEGYIMSSRNIDDTQRPIAYGNFSKFSVCSAATLAQQLPTYSCLFTESARSGCKNGIAETARSVCGNGVVETERGEQCDCGCGDEIGVCVAGGADRSFVTDAYCNASTCLFIEGDIQNASSPPAPYPPPVAYQPHPWCDTGCGEGYTKGNSTYITDVPWDSCLRCETGYIKDECSDTIAPYRGWEDDTAVRETNCAWTGCAASNAGCGDGETVSETVQCAVDGSTEGTNVRCCQRTALWTCCGVLECSDLPAPAPPPSPPPTSTSPPPRSPFPAPPAPVVTADDDSWGWGMISDDDDLQGAAAFESAATDVAISGDGTRIAIGAYKADGTDGVRGGGRVRVFKYDGGDSWSQVGADLLGGALDGFGEKVGMSDDGKRIIIAAPSFGFDNAGMVQVYLDDKGTWVNVGQNLTGDEDFAWYGSDVAMSKTKGERVFVAGGKTTAEGVFAGVVRAYEFREPSDNPEEENLGWTQVGADITDYAFSPISQPSGTHHHASLETNLGVSDDGLVLAIGTPLSTKSDDDDVAGSVRVYTYASTTWTHDNKTGLLSGDDGDLFGSSIAVSGDGACVAVGAPGNNNGAGYVFVYQRGDSGWVQKGAAINGERRDDGLGVSVDLSTNCTVLAAGATGFDGDVQGDAWGEEAGKTRLFEWQDPVWIERGSGPVGEAAGDGAGSSIGLSGDGSRVVIASVGNDGGALGVTVDAGVARVYEWTPALDGTTMPPPPVANPTSSPPPSPPSPPPPTPPPPPSPSPPPVIETWQKFGDDVDGESSGDAIGKSLSLSGDGFRLGVGGSGVARVFQWTASNWAPLGTNLELVTPKDLGSDEDFGISISLSMDGSRVAVGAKSAVGETAEDTDAGRVRVFQWDASASRWNVIGNLVGQAKSDMFGGAVSISSSGARLVIGAAYNNINDAVKDTGHVRVFEFATSEVWNRLGSDVTGTAAGENFGSAVAMAGDGKRMAVGANRADIMDGDTTIYEQAGYVAVYEWNSTSVPRAWKLVGERIFGAPFSPSGVDRFGSSVSISNDGSIVAAGSAMNDVDGTKGRSNAGHVRVFKWNNTAWEQLGSAINGSASSDEFGKSVSLSGDGSRIAVGAPGNDAAADASFDEGRARVYIYDPGTSDWEEIGTVHASATGSLNGEAGTKKPLARAPCSQQFPILLSDTPLSITSFCRWG